MNHLYPASPSSEYRWWVISQIQDHWSTAALAPVKERNKSLLLLTPFYLNFNLLAHFCQLWCISNSKMAIFLGVVPIVLALMEAFVAPSMSACLRRGKANASKQHSGPALWNSPWGLKDLQLMSVCLFIISFERALKPCNLLNAERQEIGFGNLRINFCSWRLFFFSDHCLHQNLCNKIFFSMHLLILLLRLYKVTSFNVMAVFAYKCAVQFYGVKTLIPQLVMTLHVRSAVGCDAKSFNIICDLPFQVTAVKTWNWSLS